eukprot:5459329-Alexandrium_andersonii.AAC.1
MHTCTHARVRTGAQAHRHRRTDAERPHNKCQEGESAKEITACTKQGAATGKSDATAAARKERHIH